MSTPEIPSSHSLHDTAPAFDHLQIPAYTTPPGVTSPNYYAPPNQPYLRPGMPGPLFLQAQNSSLAIASMVLGIIGLTFLPLVGSIVAVVTGHIARNEIKHSNGAFTGDGFATAGLVLGYVGIGLSVLIALTLITIAALFAFNFPYLIN